MHNVILVILVVLFLLIINELWWRHRTVHTEFGRKFIHVTVGTFVAAWPWLLSWRQIEALSLAFLVVIIISKLTKFFQAIHSVQRPTMGEVFFAVAVGSIALVTHDKWIYAAALLQMALADGLAAVIGVQFGNRLKYLIFNYPKSVVGTLTFFVVSVAILVAYSHASGQMLGVGFVVGVSLLATAMENVAVWGLDNLLVPLLVAVLLVIR
jgi:phytol kinase